MEGKNRDNVHRDHVCGRLLILCHVPQLFQTTCSHELWSDCHGCLICGTRLIHNPRQSKLCHQFHPHLHICIQFRYWINHVGLHFRDTGPERLWNSWTGQHVHDMNIWRVR